MRHYIQYKPLTKNQMYSTKMAELEFSDLSEVFSTRTRKTVSSAHDITGSSEMIF